MKGPTMKPRRNSPSYVTADGAVWKFTPAQFDAFRVALTEGKGPYIGDFGRLIIVNLISLRDLERECEVAEDDDNFGMVKGSDLKVGDLVEVWWHPNRDIITKLEPYKGSLAHLFPKGAQLAEFFSGKVGMTVDNSDYYYVHERKA